MFVYIYIIIYVICVICVVCIYVYMGDLNSMFTSIRSQPFSIWSHRVPLPFTKMPIHISPFIVPRISNIQFHFLIKHQPFTQRTALFKFLWCYLNRSIKNQIASKCLILLKHLWLRGPQHTFLVVLVLSHSCSRWLLNFIYSYMFHSRYMWIHNFLATTFIYISKKVRGFTTLDMT